MLKKKENLRAKPADGEFDTGEMASAVFGATPECIKLVARDGRLLKMNPAGLAMIEADSWESVDGVATSELIAPEHRAYWLQQHLRVCNGERQTWEFDIIGLRGTRRHMETHAVPITNAAGDTAQLAITRDVTARKNSSVELVKLNAELEHKVRERTAELELALTRLTETERGFGLLVDGVTDYAIYMLAPDGRIVSWNSGAKRIKGYDADEVIGQNFQIFYTEEDRAAGKPLTGLQTAGREGRLETEGWRLRKDGSRFWANVIIDAIYSNGQLIGFAKITRDITERRATEAKLRQAQKMEAVGQFTGGAAHDFNNLLMAIMGSLEIMRKRLPNDPKLHSLLDNAVQGAKRGASLTQRMLAFARRQELKTEIVELTELVNNVNDLMERSLGPTVSIELRFPQSRIHVRTDPNQLETALLNLAINARDAMPHGGAITIGVREELITASHATGLGPGPFSCLAVSDTGAGMDAVTLARATEPFFTTKGVGKGTGLGLSMVDGLAAQSGGKLLLSSVPGKGTTVEIWLPIVTPANLAEEPDVISGTFDVSQLSTRICVLAVDDDSLVLANVVAMLEDLGHDVIGAASASNALTVFDANPGIDLVISDQVMPTMTGLQLLEALRARRPSLPVILATGYAEFPAGVDSAIGRLAKPYTQQELKSAMNSSLKAYASRSCP
ncbi:MAG: PAS domain S-box protein [Gammaproteobacteria bacterium]